MPDTVEDLVKEANLEGWRLLNLFQISDGWQCNLQATTKNGSTLNAFCEFSQATTMLQALRGALSNARARPIVKQKDAVLSEAAEARLTKVMVKWTQARKEFTHGRTGSDDRKDDL